MSSTGLWWAERNMYNHCDYDLMLLLEGLQEAWSDLAWSFPEKEQWPRVFNHLCFCIGFAEHLLED